MTTTHRRPSRLRRSWLFLAGADHDALVEGAASGADVLIQELETFRDGFIKTDRPAEGYSSRSDSNRV